MKRSSIVRCAALLLFAAACGGGGSTAPASNSTGSGNTGGTSGGNSGAPLIPPNTVIAEGSADAFNPESITVPAGTTVTFTFESTGHNVTFDPISGRPADIPGTNTNVSIQRQFTVAGTFTYQCTIHSGMTGTVIVTQ